MIVEKLNSIKKTIPDHVKLVAVSKTKPNEMILEAYNAGHKVFGENKIQDLAKKASELPKDIEWHFIGHLQTNKVKYIASFVKMIHAVDSLKLLKVINNEARKSDRIIDCLLQIYIAKEESKFGLSAQEADDLLGNPEFLKLKNINICGLMGMATYTQDENVVRSEFRFLAESFSLLKSKYFTRNSVFCEISMGMSDDYTIAVEEGVQLSGLEVQFLVPEIIDSDNS